METTFCDYSPATKRLLFVCLGNICRSPAAEGVMRKMVHEAGLDHLIEIRSAGTYGGHAGELPDMRIRQAAAARGYRLESRSCQFTNDDFSWADMIVVMDDNNFRDVSAMSPTVEASAKIHRFAEFCTMPEVHYVPDPYYGGMRGFSDVMDILEDGCRGLLKNI